jgi:hypothetical protein
VRTIRILRPAEVVDQIVLDASVVEIISDEMRAAGGEALA